MELDDWFLTAAERGNPATGIDRRHAHAWTTGNEVRPLIHGATYFAALALVRRCAAGRATACYFTDWRGDPDEAVDASGASISSVLAGAAARGATVNGLVWRSHWDRLAFSAAENRRLGAEIEAAGGCCLLDMRVRFGGSHHQKFVVIRHGAGRRGRRTTWRSSAASTCATADATTSATGAIRNASRWPRSTETGRHGMTRRSPFAGPAVGDLEYVVPRALARPAAARAGAVAAHRRPGQRRATSAQDRCPTSRPTRRRSAPTPCRSCAPIPKRLHPLPVRTGRRAQRRPRVPQGAAARAFADLHRRPVPVVGACRRGVCGCAPRPAAAAHGRRLAVASRPGRQGDAATQRPRAQRRAA